MVRLDLHLHTDRSDGWDTPQTVLAAVRRRGLRLWSVTDHDSVDAYARLRGEPGLLPGVEISASVGAREVHILGLGIDPAQPHLERLLGEIVELRERRAAGILAHVAATRRCPIPLAACRCPPARVITRSHIARALVRVAVVRNFAEAFDELLGDRAIAGLALPHLPPVAEVAATIRAAGGVALLAHPGHLGDLAAIRAVLDTGKLDGLELKHPRCDAVLQEQLRELATAEDLIISAGSDHHGGPPGRRAPLRIGDFRLSHAEVAPLLARVGARVG